MCAGIGIGVQRYSKPAHLQTRRIPLQGFRVVGLIASGGQGSPRFGDRVNSEKRRFPGTRSAQAPGNLPRARK